MAKKVEFRMGKQLKEILMEKNLVKKDLADFLEVTPPAITRCLNEQTNLNYDNLHATCDWLNISADRLFQTGLYKFTVLREYAYMSPEKVIDKPVPHQPDETGKTLLDYVLEQGDFEKFYFHHEYDHYIEVLHNDPRILDFIVRTSEYGFLSGKIKSKVKSINSGYDGLRTIKRNYEFPVIDYVYNSKGKYTKQFQKHEFIELTKQTKDILKTIFSSQSFELLKCLPYKPIDGEYPIIFYYAIQQDAEFVVKYYRETYRIPFTMDHFQYSNEFGGYCGGYIVSTGDLKI